MPVFTAAVLSIAAVGSAVGAAATVAAVATAVVTTSIAIGVAGLAVTAIGVITKNEGLLKAGKIMGYIGLAGGLAGGVIGGLGGLLEGGAGLLEGASGAYSGASTALKEGWEQGLGSVFSPTTGAEVVGGQAVSNTTANGVGTALPQIGGPQPTALTSLDPSITPATSTIGPGTTVSPAAAYNPATSGITPWTPATPPSPLVPNSPLAPVTPGIGQSITNSLTQAAAPPVVGANGVLLPGASGVAQGASTSLPDWIKYSAMTTGGQGLSGLAAGWYQGASAEQRLEFEKLQNEQKQTQLQYLNRNNQYAPLLQFNGPTNPAG